MKLSRTHRLEDAGQATLGFRVEEVTRVPASDWQTPDLSSLPDRLAGVIGVDTETDDAGLRAERGPGWAWEGGGRVVGYSVCADNCRVYLPIGHIEGNVDPVQARCWLNHVLGDPTQTKVFANALYDDGWATQDGVKIAYDPGKIIDIQLVEPLLDEHRLSYDLNSIARDRVGRGKDEVGLLEAGRAYGLGQTLREVKSRIASLPAKYVGPYAEEDAQLPREIWAAQSRIIDDEGLGQISAVEHGLIPMYLDMRRRGVRIDVARVERMHARLRGEVDALRVEVKRLTGLDVEIWEARSVAKLLDHLGVPYGRTPKSREPQINNKVLEYDHPALAAVLSARQKDKLRGTFLEGQLLDQLHSGRVHGQVHPLKGDEGGAVTGRISMSNPNLLFIPARTEEGKEVRRCFIPEDGELWMKDDVSQQEVRLLVHFAVMSHLHDTSNGRRGMPSALEAKRRYEEEPDLNYHEFVAEVTGLVYRRAKILNLAIIYGRGVKETAVELEVSEQEAKALFARHAEKMPFAKQMSYRCQDRVRERGYLTTLLKRRQRFPLYEPTGWDERDGRMLPLERAQLAWPGLDLTRARIHKSLNALVQPSAADQTKKAMLDLWRAGLGKYVGIQVYDEFDGSVPDERVAKQVGEVVESAVKLEVPVLVDVGVGPSWGDVE